MVNRTTKQQRSAPTPVSPVPDLAHSIQGIADVIFKALEAPLRAQVEACVQAVVHEATRDIHARIAAEIARIQPINIPINLFAQTAHAPVSAPIPAPAVAMPTCEVEDEPIEEPVEDIEEEIEEAVIEETTEEAVEEIYDEVESEPAPEPEPVPPVTPIAETPRPAARKNLSVTIVGLKPGQAHMIKNEFRWLKLHFISSDAGAGPQLKSLAKTNDYVVQMTDFIRHSVTDSVKAANGNGNWIYVSGGMTTLREKLQELMKGHVTPA